MEGKLEILFAYIIWFGLLLMLAGCQPTSISVSSSREPNENTSTQQDEPTPSSTSTMPTITLKQSKAETPTIFPIETSIPTKMPTRWPTLSPDEAIEQVMTLLEGNQNSDCLLPCWWDIELGKTNWDEYVLFINSFAKSLTIFSEQNAIVGVFPIPSTVDSLEELNIGYRLNEKREIVEISIASINIDGYDPVTMMTLYGVPDEVWLSTMSAPREGILPFQLIIVYQEKGISFRYYVNANKVDDTITVCFEPGSIETERPTLFPASPRIYLWEPKEPKPIEEISSIPREQYFPLETKSSLTPETFYQRFIDPNQQPCIDTPSEQW